MFKRIIALAVCLAIANAGYLGTPLAYHAPLVAAPVAVKAAIPVATSYQNTVQISAAPVVVKAAPIVAAPVHVAPAPVLHYAHSPAIIKSPLLAAPSFHH